MPATSAIRYHLCLFSRFFFEYRASPGGFSLRLTPCFSPGSSYSTLDGLLRFGVFSGLDSRLGCLSHNFLSLAQHWDSGVFEHPLLFVQAVSGDCILQAYPPSLVVVSVAMGVSRYAFSPKYYLRRRFFSFCAYSFVHTFNGTCPYLPLSFESSFGIQRFKRIPTIWAPPFFFWPVSTVWATLATLYQFVILQLRSSTWATHSLSQRKCSLSECLSL